jgi:hypothetical protein
MKCIIDEGQITLKKVLNEMGLFQQKSGRVTTYLNVSLQLLQQAGIAV